MFNCNAFYAAIKAKGETQGDAAKVMQINLATLHRKVTGKSDFYRREIELFCLHYQVNPDEVFFNPDSA